MFGLEPAIAIALIVTAIAVAGALELGLWVAVCRLVRRRGKDRP